MSVSNGDANSEDAARANYRTRQHPHGPYQSAYLPWAMHPPYPMQGMPYYPGVNPYYPPPYPAADDPRYNHSERRPSRKHSSDSKDLENSDDESDQTGSERESSHGHKSSKKGKRSSKNKLQATPALPVQIFCRELRIEFCSWDALPDYMEHLASLQRLDIPFCTNIWSLPALPQSLEHFSLGCCDKLSMSSCYMEHLASPQSLSISLYDGILSPSNTASIYQEIQTVYQE